MQQPTIPGITAFLMYSVGSAEQAAQACLAIGEDATAKVLLLGAAVAFGDFLRAMQTENTGPDGVFRRI